MARVEFKDHGILEIPAETSFIHPLESGENLSGEGTQYVLGVKLST